MKITTEATSKFFSESLRVFFLVSKVFHPKKLPQYFPTPETIKKNYFCCSFPPHPYLSIASLFAICGAWKRSIKKGHLERDEEGFSLHPFFNEQSKWWIHTRTMYFITLFRWCSWRGANKIFGKMKSLAFITIDPPEPRGEDGKYNFNVDPTKWNFQFHSRLVTMEIACGDYDYPWCPPCARFL